MNPRVYSCRKGAKTAPPPNSIYVGRPSKWGNSFHLDRESERKTVLDRYERWVLSQPALVQEIKQELRGKNLVCWCSPKLCHADTLLRIANE